MSERLALLAGLATAALGLPFLLHAFGPTEAEVAAWGELALLLGAAVAGLSLLPGRRTSRLARAVLGGWLVLAALIQVPPAVLWVAFHGRGISDGVPPSLFQAHWALGVPHLLVAALAVAAVCRDLGCR